MYVLTRKSVCALIMRCNEMKVTYISHSGFMLETEQAYFLFDYYKGLIPDRESGKPLVVFVSHRHADHYNPHIFELVKEKEPVHFVLSKDVRINRQIEKYQEQGINLNDYITIVKRNEERELTIANGTSLHIATMASTDEGVAFLLRCDGKIYYHAGDLNLWVWEGETKQYNNNMTANYFRELEKLKGMEIDAAFVPLDPRQGKDAFGGMESFLEYTLCKKVFPMHFWGEFGIIEEFIAKHPEYKEQIAVIEREGQEFSL